MKPLIDIVQHNDDIAGALIIIAIGVGGICVAAVIILIINFWRYIMSKIRPEGEILQFPVIPELIEYYKSIYESGIDIDEMEEDE